eukprot:TRINITY_DN36118_c0_g1_i1.p1 TRINITY_DN36118_c0_g1~~TRINITY_DN36118_c0_g1_i1.p1  ORF type:complete len:140 (-),score=15.34 TRINITY_DN36118_c0_g1_i1:55-474(-)
MKDEVKKYRRWYEEPSSEKKRWQFPDVCGLQVGLAVKLEKAARTPGELLVANAQVAVRRLLMVLVVALPNELVDTHADAEDVRSDRHVAPLDRLLNVMRFVSTGGHRPLLDRLREGRRDGAPLHEARKVFGSKRHGVRD